MDKSTQFKESKNRLEMLVKAFNLNPNLIKYWNEGRLYYSYLTGGGLLASIDTITYDPNYQKIVKEYEERTGNLVYHVIESRSLLNLLYVSAPDKNISEDEQREIWDMELMNQTFSWVSAYVINLDNPELSEHGDIFLDVYQGVLVRTE
ncbi:TPA: hypothetical protein VM496_000642 [Streptococcus pyogenes]|nr:hypothetical protein [Streptococcus pyogenes]